jgi:hypothetical protein
MTLVVKSLALSGLGLSFSALGSVCQDGELSKRQLLVDCTAKDLTDSRNGIVYPELKFCVSREWREGGPFGGEKVPWFYTHIEAVDANGAVQTYTFDNPDGRHNFRSMIDFTELYHDDYYFSLLSNRTVYPGRLKAGKIHIHQVEFDFGSGELSVSYDRSERVLFGKVTDILHVQGICR